ncbi:unnamed protein product [Merluccius merluccius]
MVVLRIRNAHKRKYVFICLSIFGFIMYRYLGTPAVGRRLNRKVGLNANTSQFTLAGEPFRILGGSVHYFRVPRAYWRDRLMKTKACGINTITTYVPWSLHQPERGVFNFHTQLDLESYISLAAELGLWVILRPGPYISAELDLGGLPSWLLQDKNMRLRTTYPGFTEAVNVFFDKLIPKVVPLQFKKGGPVIAVQLDNSYGSFAKDDGYMSFVKEALTSRGISELLLTSDHPSGLKAGGVNGAIRTVKLWKLHTRDMQELNSVQPHSPTLVMDCWSGMVDAWGDLHHVLPPEDMVSAVREILRRGMSINLYMFHGGTSFGFMSGLVGDVLLNGTPLRDFTIYSLDMKPSFIDSLYRAPWKALPEVPCFPAFFMGSLFAYGYPSDTFVKLPGWGKGAVFINGVNLGRYWSSGPQQALYLPGPLLNSGMNQIIVFEEQEADFKIQLENMHDLGMAADIQ